MRVPAISYRATVNEYYDYGFYQLPNRLSHQCFDFEELRETLGKILAGELGATDGNERRSLIDHFLAARSGPLACERIVDVLEKIAAGRSRMPAPNLKSRVDGHLRATARRLTKRFLSYLPDSHNRPEFHRHRYPGISLDEVRQRALRIKKVLGDSNELAVDQIAEEIFQIGPQLRKNRSIQIEAAQPL